ncbi:hypothetical protein PCASD_02178 [Puccinia coronata f. sp. avenae]|uniref:Uncharacterized protein n=1 Tax=Puccinia coronata f. sp. avenae TaxID=200324 RepID=A0A2N5VHZ2_9BASI|nr:hypothetical protein PCASD_02178 [Puccinia coronata f. sp. avenae]
MQHTKDSGGARSSSSGGLLLSSVYFPIYIFASSELVVGQELNYKKLLLLLALSVSCNRVYKISNSYTCFLATVIY